MNHLSYIKPENYITRFDERTQSSIDRIESKDIKWSRFATITTTSDHLALMKEFMIHGKIAHTLRTTKVIAE